MSISNSIASIIRKLSRSHSKYDTAQVSASGQGTYLFPANATAGYSSCVWVTDYNCGVHLRVPV